MYFGEDFAGVGGVGGVLGVVAVVVDDIVGAEEVAADFADVVGAFGVEVGFCGGDAVVGGFVAGLLFGEEERAALAEGVELE